MCLASKHRRLARAVSRKCQRGSPSGNGKSSSVSQPSANTSVFYTCRVATPRRIPLYDPSSNPSTWSERMTDGQYAIHFSEFDDGHGAGDDYDAPLLNALHITREEESSPQEQAGRPPKRFQEHSVAHQLLLCCLLACKAGAFSRAFLTCLARPSATSRLSPFRRLALSIFP